MANALRSGRNALNPMGGYQNMLAANQAATVPGSGVVGMARNRRSADFEEEQAIRAAEIAQYGRPLNSFERMTSSLPVSDSPAQIQSNLANVMGSTWGGGIAGTVLDDPLRAAANVLNPRRSSGFVPLTTYHGSPHRINNVTPDAPLGRFDLSKIGTGEGAQAYGHGIYLAETPGVARSYQVMGDGKDLVIRKGGKEIARGDAINDDALEAMKLLDMGKRDAGQFPHNAAYYAKKRAEGNEKLLSLIDEYKDATFTYEKNPGHFYTVDLPDEHIAKMLDWDAPLSEQPEMIRQIADDMGIAGPRTEEIYYQNNIAAGMDPKKARTQAKLTANDKGMTGESLYNALVYQARDAAIERGQNAATTLPAAQAKASQDLRELGIPGIRYLDGGSRAAGEGTRNFVIFDPDIAKIIGRE